MRKIFVISLAVLCIFALSGNCSAADALKKTVAVFDFKNDSGYKSIATFGKDFSAQLNDALVQSDQFIVLSRKDLDVVMAEQDLARSDRFAKSNSAQTGKIIPAQILIKGTITEFQENTSGGGGGLEIKGFKIGTKKSSAHIAVIVQLVNSTTGEIVDSKRVEGQAKGGGLSLGYSGSFDISSSNFKKTPLGKAVQMAIDRAVVYIGKKMKDVKWRGKVVLMKEDGTVFVNAGANSGIEVGNRFEVYHEGEKLIDPDTGIELGSDTTKVAEISVTQVQEKFSKANVIGNLSGTISKGDIVQK